MATVAAVAACAVGVPLPAVVFKPSAQRFPCESHACGCVDAESCWRDCCCMTHAEKLTWAARNGVTPPAIALAAARREAAATKLACGGCCAAKAKSCCRAKQSCCGGGASAPAGRGTGIAFVQFAAAMKCRGLTVSVAMLPPSLPALPEHFALLVLERYSQLLGRTLLYDEPYLAVDTPPPDARCA